MVLHSPLLRARQRLNEVRPRRPEQSVFAIDTFAVPDVVSMKSGLEGRNNGQDIGEPNIVVRVSMKSGLEGRNNNLFNLL